MTTEVILPKLGFSMNEGILSAWLVEDGTVVTKGQPLYALESTRRGEIEAPRAGGSGSSPARREPIGRYRARPHRGLRRDQESIAQRQP